MNPLRKALATVASIDILLVVLILLMTIVFLGTINQGDMGLFQVQATYFQSWFYWLAIFPLPGGKTLLLIFSVNLLAQLIFKTRFGQIQKVGIHIAHTGSLLLVLSCLYIFKFTEEGSLNIKEAESLQYFKDFKNYEFIVTSLDLNSNEVKEFRFLLNLKDSNEFFFEGHKFKVLKIIENCQLKEMKRKSFIGFASQFSFIKTDHFEKRDSDLCLEFKHEFQDQIHQLGVFHLMPRLQTLSDAKVKLTFQIDNQRKPIPFKIRLNKFEKEYYQDTSIAKSFKSYVTIIDQDKEFDSIIEMNSPLRYKGYTFFQAAFSENSDASISQFSVSKNQGEKLPYVASFIIALGILIHLFFILKKNRLRND